MRELRVQKDGSGGVWVELGKKVGRMGKLVLPWELLLWGGIGGEGENLTREI